MPVGFNPKMTIQNIFQTGYLRTMSVNSETSGIYDMNELPYISQSRNLLVVVCVLMFFTASCVYMPLGNIQADYDRRCFLDTKLDFDINKLVANGSSVRRGPKMRLHLVETEWGPIYMCDMTTFTPVMVGILCMIIGWSTFTVWPTMMEMGKGGGLMLVYTFLFVLCLGSTIASTIMLFSGYNNTCRSLDSSSISCTQLNSKVVQLKEDGEYIIVHDIHGAIIIAQVASTALIGLSCLQIFVSMGTFGIIWYHFNFLAMQLYSIDGLSLESNSQPDLPFSFARGDGNTCYENAEPQSKSNLE